MKNEKGITLIALIITIIVLLILLSVAITTIINGKIFTITNKSKEQYIQAQEKEILMNAQNCWNVEKISKQNFEDTFQDFITNELQAYNVEVQDARKILFSNEDCLIITFNETKNRYKLSDETIKEVGITNTTEIKVGDYVNYMPSTSGEYDVEFLNMYSGVLEDNNSAIDNNNDGKIDTTELTCPGWRILRIYPDGSIDLIGDSTNKSIYLRGTVGYNNGVFLLNDICANLFSNQENNINARSYNINDLESYLTEKGLQTRNEYINMVYTSDVNNAVKYSTPNTLKGKISYPILFGFEKNSGVETDIVKENGIDASDSYYSKEELCSEEGLGKSYLTTTNKLTATGTYYVLPINKDNYGDAYTVLKGKSWVATRLTLMETRAAIEYCLATVNSENFVGRILAYSHLRLSIQNYSIRPVVSIPSSVQIIPCSGKNSNKNPHQIEYK